MSARDAKMEKQRALWKCLHYDNDCIFKILNINDCIFKILAFIAVNDVHDGAYIEGVGNIYHSTLCCYFRFLCKLRLGRVVHQFTFFADVCKSVQGSPTHLPNYRVEV